MPSRARRRLANATRARRSTVKVVEEEWSNPVDRRSA
jgi:hypothetical protein